MDLFDKIERKPGPLGQYFKEAHGYFAFPKLEGEISSRMLFRGKEKIIWSINNYLGLANNAEVRKADAEAAKKWGLAYPMGARMMSGQTKYHEQLEQQLAEFVSKKSAFLLNYGYQGMVSIIDSLVDRNDVIIYDSESHACILDGMRLHIGKRFVFPHNDIKNLEKELERATNLTDKTGGAILIVIEGVFGMSGDLGKIDEIVALKDKYNFRLLVDDAHGFGTMGKTGAGTGEELGVQDKIDLYFATFAKSMAGIGAFVASDNENIINYLMYNMRSQIFAKSLPMPMVIGAMKRLELLKTRPELKRKLWENVRYLQKGLKALGLNLGNTQSPITPIYLSGDIPEATNLTVDLRKNYNIFCTIVVYPIVPKDVILLRLIPTTVHTKEDIDITINAFAHIKENLKNGKYTTGKIADIAE